MAGPTPKHFTMSDLKSKILHPAQTSVYMVDITTGGALERFVSSRGVNFAADSEMINLSCCEASLPGSSLATHEVTGDYAGVTEKMAYRRIYDDTIDLTFYVDHQYKVIEYLESWMSYIVGEGSTFTRDEYVNRSAFYRMNYPKEYKYDIHIVKFEKTASGINNQKSKVNQPQQSRVLSPTLKYQFIGAFPSNIVSMPISYDGSNLLKVTASFSYMRYVRVSSFQQAGSGAAAQYPITPTEQAAFNSPGNPELKTSPIGGYNFTPNQTFNNAQFGTDTTGQFGQTGQNLTINPLGSNI